MPLALLLLVLALLALTAWSHYRSRMAECDLAGVKQEVSDLRADYECCVTRDEMDGVLRQELAPALLADAQAIAQDGDRRLEEAVAAHLRNAGMLEFNDAVDSSCARGGGPPPGVRRRRGTSWPEGGRPASGTAEPDAELEKAVRASRPASGALRRRIAVEGSGEREEGVCPRGVASADDSERLYEQEFEVFESEDPLLGGMDGEGGDTDAVEGMQEVLSNVAHIFGHLGARHDIKVRSGEVTGGRVIITTPPSFLAGAIGAGARNYSAPQILREHPRELHRTAAIEELGESDIEGEGEDVV